MWIVWSFKNVNLSPRGFGIVYLVLVGRSGEVSLGVLKSRVVFVGCMRRTDATGVVWLPIVILTCRSSFVAPPSYSVNPVGLNMCQTPSSKYSVGSEVSGVVVGASWGLLGSLVGSGRAMMVSWDS